MGLHNDGESEFTPPVRRFRRRVSAELDAVFPESAGDWLPTGSAVVPRQQDRHRPRAQSHRPKRSGSTSATRAKASSSFTNGTTRAPTRSCRPSPATRSKCCSKPSRTKPAPSSCSYRKAKRQKEWEDVIAKHKEGDVVTGAVTRKIKGGLLVNIGVNVFLPASQVDIRRPPDIGDYIGKTIECKILKIDEARRNIVVSRRKLIEDQRDEMKTKLLAEIEPGQIRKGVVKNIAEFGAFVDLGGIDGLLHITDMAWGRVTNPHEVVHIDQELEVYIITVDKDKEKIALGLKQKSPSPWDDVESKYPIGSRHTGEVVNVMSYGAFVKLEPGIEGPGPHQRDELDQAHQPSQRAGLNRRSRSKCRSSTSTRTSRKSRSASSRCSPTRGTRWPNATRPAPRS